MDISSDSDSERWEDFFGSSTELAPSLLGIYDTLTNTLDASYQTNNNNNNNNNSNNSNNSNNNSTSNCSDTADNSSSSSSTIVASSIEQSAEQSLNNNVDSLSDAQQSSGSKEQQTILPPTNLTQSATQDTSTQQQPASAPATVKSRDSLASKSSTNSNHNNSVNSNTNSHTASSKHRNNIRVLSPNVQRLVTHSDAEPVDTVDIDALQQHLKSPALLSPIAQPRYAKRACSTPNTQHSNSHNHKGVQHKVKLSHIPLSKITGKLTQSGNELVETFDSSSEYLDAIHFTQSEKKVEQRSHSEASVKQPATPAVVQIPKLAGEQTTPTNNDPVSVFNFACNLKLTLPKSLSQESIQLIEMEQLATATQLLNALSNNHSAAPVTAAEAPQSPQTNRTSRAFIATEPPLTPMESVEAINFTLVAKNIEQLTLSDAQHGISISSSSSCNSSMSSMDGGPQFVEAINKPLISKPLVRSSSAACASTVAGSPPLTYARSKSLQTKANTLAIPIKLPTAEQLEELEEASRISAESLDRLTDIKSKFSPKETRKINGSLMLPDIAKLKHRPLSSSSICSTSSSSSSGSELLNGKQATSYLASVESLADQSETELIDPHTGMSVFERACLEIVDSERSYVEDLGQVIRGYLHDWKERACLRIDELQILFSNIEEIYEFNSTLLKQLINSGMDPVKIAKCFIELRERFDVYTKYCTQYPEAISLLTKLLQATHTNALLNSTQKMLHHTLPLGSYLLKPVQRILKYHLLLDNLRKHCDVKEVFQAYEIMRQVARNIDQVKRKLEQQSRVKELSGILDGWLGPELTVLGELRQEGLLMEHNKPRMVFLFGTMLIITKPKEDSRLQFKSYIHQNNLMLSEHLPGEPTSFYVIPYHEPRNQIKLTAKNRDQKRLWAQHIKGVILEKFDNIPNRAKELVYKLGDEEDRTPDKHTWKWSRHSTSSTPVYIERRNQYRRSEMRNRAKFKRKTVANSSSFDSFNELAEHANEVSSPKPTKPVQRNNSMDESVLPTLQKFAAAMRNRSSKPPESTNAANNTEQADATTKSNNAEELKATVDEQKAEQSITREPRSTPKSPKFNYKALKERSKSVPRISFAVEEESLSMERESLHGSKTNLDERKSVSSKTVTTVEVKQYNHKTLPKRITTLKKQRQSKKETSKFYLDLADFDVTKTETVLKITESTENLLEKKSTNDDSVDAAQEATNDAIDELYAQIIERKEEDSGNLTPAEKAKRDAQIILDLLKHNKEFEKLCNKSQKKRSIDTTALSPTRSLRVTEELPPRPPSRSPPPLETDTEAATEHTTSTKHYEPEADEPIYESLLRNVHVPYKFSPVLGRAKSAGYTKQRDKKPALPRPESDYVTLVYSPEGQLQLIGGECVVRTMTLRQNSAPEQERNSTGSTSSSASSTSSSTMTLKRDSQQTVISVEGIIAAETERQPPSTNGSSDAIYARPMPKNLMKRLLHAGSGSNKSSMENVSTSESSLFPRTLKSIDNITLVFGRSNRPPERRVSDVTEMCRQSILHRQGSEAVGERMAHLDYADPRTLFAVASSEASLQRDSVFSLTSSNDSVCDQKRAMTTSMELSTNFEYEDDVEACLENDFRDSAIYSDDNEKRIEYDAGKKPRAASPTDAPPPLPPARTRKYPSVPPKPTHIPVPKVVSPAKSTTDNQQKQDMSLPGVIVCPPHLSQAASRSWVLQQIENFNK